MYSRTWCVDLLEKVEMSAARPQEFWNNLYDDLRNEGLLGDSLDIEHELLKDLRFNKGRCLFVAWKPLIKSGGKRPDPAKVHAFVFKFKEVVWERHFASMENDLFNPKTT